MRILLRILLSIRWFFDEYLEGILGLCFIGLIGITLGVGWLLRDKHNPNCEYRIVQGDKEWLADDILFRGMDALRVQFTDKKTGAIVNVSPPFYTEEIIEGERTVEDVR